MSGCSFFIALPLAFEASEAAEPGPEAEPLDVDGVGGIATGDRGISNKYLCLCDTFYKWLQSRSVEIWMASEIKSWRF